MTDNVNNPQHYTEHPSGIQCIEVTEHMGFNLGNAIKYIWRCDLKKDAIEDLEKAVWYLNRELLRRKLYSTVGKEDKYAPNNEHSHYFYDKERNKPIVAMPGYSHFKDCKK